MKIGDNEFVLSSGRVILANCGILGISCSNGEGIIIHEGYDGSIDSKKFTKEERKEIAEYIISLWERWWKGESNANT